MSPLPIRLGQCLSSLLSNPNRLGTKNQSQWNISLLRKIYNNLRNFLRQRLLVPRSLPQLLGHGAHCLLVRLADRRNCHRRPGPVGPDAPGLQHRHLDAKRRHLLRHHRREPADRPLGALVGAEPGNADPAADGRDLEDVAGPLLPEDGHGRLGDVHDAHEVGVDLLAEVGRFHVLERGCVGVAGVVDDHVDAAELLVAGVDGCEDLALVGYVQGEGEKPAWAELLGEGVETLDGPRCCDDRRAGGESGLDDCPAEAAGGAGDEPDFGHGGEFDVGICGVR